MKRLLDILFIRKNLFIMLFVIVLGYGIYSYFVIPKQEMPKIDTPYMAVSITAPGVSASYLETNVVDDVEKVILTYQDVTEVRSYVYDNFALSYVVFSYSANDTTALSEDIFKKINELSIDEAVTDLSYQSGVDDPPIIFSIYGDDASNTDLINASDAFKNELLTIDQIKTVTIHNAFSDEVVIQLDSAKLALYQLTMYDVYQILDANTLNIPLGGLNTEYGTISISGYREYDNLDDLRSLIIIPEVPTISPAVTLGDLSMITLEDTSNEVYTFDGEKALFISVYFEDNIDFTVLGDTVLQAKDNFLSDYNNPSIHINQMVFLPDYVNQQINNVFYSLLLAIAVVMVVVLIGIGFRNSLLIILTIPVIVFGTIGVLYLTHYELHKLTIVGLIIAIGIMVDNSIVITEGIKRNIDYGMNKIDGAKAAILSNFGPILSSTLTTIAAFIVIVLLPGFLGRIVSSMPLTVIITLSLSYLVSMILSPIIAVLFLKPSKKIKSKDHLTIHYQRIKKMIRNTIKFPLAWILLATVALIIVTYFTFTNQPLDLYPNEERSVLYIDFENDTLGDLDSTKALRDTIIEQIKDNPHIENISSSVGGGLPHFHFSATMLSTLPQFGQIYLNLDYTETELQNYITTLETNFATIDGAKITVHVLELSPPIAPVRVTVSGNDIDLVNEMSTTMFNEIKDLETVKSYNIVGNVKATKYVISYNQETISSSFLTKAEVDQVIATELNGLDLDRYRYNDDTINIHIASDVTTIPDLLNQTVFSTQLNTAIPLSSLITITTNTDYSVITRYNHQNVAYIDLYFTNDSSLNELENNVKTVISHHDTTNLTITYGGENEMFSEISTNLIKAAIIALILIYIIMFIQFNNFIKPLIVFFTIPLSFIGSFLFLLIFNSPITATALVGLVSLLGVTVNTGILLVEYISRHHSEFNNVEDACVEAVLLRFRPIMLTSFTTILGLIPLLITGGNFFQPLAITFMGGMITSTLITIFLVPSVYTLIYRNKKAS